MEWEVTFNLPSCLSKQESNLKIKTNEQNKSLTEANFVIEEDNTIKYLNKWKDLIEEEKINDN